MRVIAGTYRSRHLLPVGKLRLRPTSDRLRETLFDILGPRLSGSCFLDLFAGTGAVGIEALSGGASSVYFAEREAAACALIRRNLAFLEITAGAEILRVDALRAIELLASRGIAADLIFLDPPYDNLEAQKRTLARLETSSILAPGALIIAEHLRRVPPPPALSRLICIRSVLQGDAALSFYKLAAPPHGEEEDPPPATPEGTV
jgi:16S rRNA (guanine966-N2)-methyltransferase